MATVRVSFTIESDDPDDETGVTNETYEKVLEAAMSVGGEDVEFEKEEE